MTDQQSPRPFARRHHWIVRLTHWATVIVLAGLIASGLQIYEAYARFGNRGGPYFVSPFDGAQFPQWSRLGGWLADGAVRRISGGAVLALLDRVDLRRIHRHARHPRVRRGSRLAARHAHRVVPGTISQS